MPRGTPNNPKVDPTPVVHTMQPEAEFPYWQLVLKAPLRGQTRLERFYDGEVMTVKGECLIPKDKPTWAIRLLKFEGYEFSGGIIPEDFKKAAGWDDV